MEKTPPRWIDTPAFNWTPETPLRAEPEFGSAPAPEAPVILTAVIAKPVIAQPTSVIPEPRFENPVLRDASVSSTRESLKVAPRVPAAAKPSLLLPRLTVGLVQGAALYALLATRNDNSLVYAAAMMVALFAPLLLLAGLGRMALRPLLLWTGFASILLAAAGAYHHWRTLVPDAGHPGLVLLALTMSFLFIGQCIALAGRRDYAQQSNAAWQLAIRIILCALFAGLCWGVISLASVFVRERYLLPQFHAGILVLMALSVALGAHLTGARFLSALQAGLLFVLNIAAPFVLILSIAVAATGALGLWKPSAMLYALLAAALVIGINASYRDGTTWRPHWVRRVEFLSALLLAPLILLAGFALAQRIGQYGWTPSRVFGAAALLMLSGYALCYAGAALISLGGGGWMQRIEGSNRALAFAGLALIAALASPMADPARLMVLTQTYRLETKAVAPEAFDFTALRRHGLRFGRDALGTLAADKTQPLVARSAFAALTAPASPSRPAPTQIGANIRVHGSSVLPADLLARDWSGVTGAPPCLTSAGMACDAFFTDLDDDGLNEILLAYGSDTDWWAGVMKQGYRMPGNPGGWYVAGTLAAPPCPGSLAALKAGRFAAVRPSDSWRDLLVNGIRLGVTRPSTGPACPAT